jgi:hypothetical protein
VWKRIWSDPVWSKVISAGILGIIALAGTYFLNWWPGIGSFFGTGVALATAETRVPNWLAVTTGLLALPAVILLAALAWQIVRPSKPVQQPWKAYASDIFFGLRWRWHYLSDDSMSDMHTFCPYCDFQVYPELASGYVTVDRILFRCESCHRELGSFDETYQSLESKAARFAQQKLRAGSWEAKGGI